jgi:hypothetical protein
VFRPCVAGRGATEIDILEAQAGVDPLSPSGLPVDHPYLSTTLQISPGVTTHRPINGKDVEKNGTKGWIPSDLVLHKAGGSSDDLVVHTNSGDIFPGVTTDRPINGKAVEKDGAFDH